MEYNFEKLTDKIYVCASSDHRFGTDAFLLADFSGYRRKDMACDLGTGCGIIPLLWCKKETGKKEFNDNYVKKAPQKIVDLDRQKLEEEKKKLEELMK